MIGYNLLLTRTGTHCTCQNAIALESQYWQFAISSIILAFFLNIATFITDIVLMRQIGAKCRQDEEEHIRG